MARSKSVPSYRLHKSSGQAVVTLRNGLGSRRDVLLGKYGTAESRAEYARVLAEWEANARLLPATYSCAGDVSVNEILLAYFRFAEGYYQKNGQPTSQLDRVQRSLRPVKELYGHTPARSFGPLALKTVRERMVSYGWVRRYVNSCVGCVKRAFKWAVENELVPPSVYQGLQAVAGLKKGRCAVPEGTKVRPVENERVDATLPHLTAPLRAMVQVQRLTGMRPGEVVLMRPCDIDILKKVWTYRPESHKTEHHDQQRVILIGPQAQEILRPFLFEPFLQDPTAIALAAGAADDSGRKVLSGRLQEIGAAWREPTAYIFSPREGMADFRARQRASRKTKVQPSQKDRRKARPRKSPRGRYKVDTYHQSVQRACIAAEIVPWHPHQLRHTAATAIRKEFGIDAARVVLGHRSPAITETYAELDLGKAAEVMERLG